MIFGNQLFQGHRKQRPLPPSIPFDESHPSHPNRIWPLETMPSQDSRFKNAEGDIWQHIVNNYDYTESELLYQRLKICSIPDEQFIRFLEVCMLPVVVRDPQRIEKLATLFNKYL